MYTKSCIIYFFFFFTSEGVQNIYQILQELFWKQKQEKNNSHKDQELFSFTWSKLNSEWAKIFNDSYKELPVKDEGLNTNVCFSSVLKPH